MRGALPPGSPLGRTGGDEFTAVFLLESETGIASFLEKLAQKCNIYNDISALPFYEGISAGCVSFSGEDTSQLPQIIKEADLLLYEAKKRRRENVLRF